MRSHEIQSFSTCLSPWTGPKCNLFLPGTHTHTQNHLTKTLLEQNFSWFGWSPWAGPANPNSHPPPPQHSMFFPGRNCIQLVQDFLLFWESFFPFGSWESFFPLSFLGALLGSGTARPPSPPPAAGTSAGLHHLGQQDLKEV